MAVPAGKIETEYVDEFKYRGETFVIHRGELAGFKVSHKALGWGIPRSSATEVFIAKERAMSAMNSQSEEQWSEAFLIARTREAARK